MNLRVGIAGAGFIGAVHARSARLAGARLFGISASNAERADQAATRLGAEHGWIDVPGMDHVKVAG